MNKWHWEAIPGSGDNIDDYLAGELVDPFGKVAIHDCCGTMRGKEGLRDLIAKLLNQHFGIEP